MTIIAPIEMRMPGNELSGSMRRTNPTTAVIATQRQSSASKTAEIHVALCSTCSIRIRSPPFVSFFSRQRSTIPLISSTTLSRPKAISKTLPAMMPEPIAMILSNVIQAMVTISRRTPARSTASLLSGERGEKEASFFMGLISSSLPPGCHPATSRNEFNAREEFLSTTTKRCVY